MVTIGNRALVCFTLSGKSAGNRRVLRFSSSQKIPGIDVLWLNLGLIASERFVFLTTPGPQNQGFQYVLIPKFLEDSD